MDKIRNAALPDNNTSQMPLGAPDGDEVEGRELGEVAATSSIEERFANWGSD
jgi:hypothetical protein